jgi:F0F1-type ATP synthase epsilon subunit
MATKKTEVAGPVKARVLVNGGFGRIDDVVTVDADTANSSDELDPSPEAVAYAESLTQPTA